MSLNHVSCAPVQVKRNDSTTYRYPCLFKTNLNNLDLVLSWHLHDHLYLVFREFSSLRDLKQPISGGSSQHHPLNPWFRSKGDCMRNLIQAKYVPDEQAILSGVAGMLWFDPRASNPSLVLIQIFINPRLVPFFFNFKVWLKDWSLLFMFRRRVVRSRSMCYLRHILLSWRVRFGNGSAHQGLLRWNSFKPLANIWKLRSYIFHFLYFASRQAYYALLWKSKH